MGIINKIKKLFKRKRCSNCKYFWKYLNRVGGVCSIVFDYDGFKFEEEICEKFTYND